MSLILLFTLLALGVVLFSVGCAEFWNKDKDNSNNKSYVAAADNAKSTTGGNLRTNSSKAPTSKIVSQSGPSSVGAGGIGATSCKLLGSSPPATGKHS